jgi:hypothetical protein
MFSPILTASINLIFLTHYLQQSPLDLPKEAGAYFRRNNHHDRAMSIAIAALRNHQVYMDVVSSNISNVNTTGFKASRISFQELLSQTLRGSSAPRGGTGGLNPIQIGLGMALGGIDTLFTQGALQDTAN